MAISAKAIMESNIAHDSLLLRQQVKEAKEACEEFLARYEVDPQGAEFPHTSFGLHALEIIELSNRIKSVRTVLIHFEMEKD